MLTKVINPNCPHCCVSLVLDDTYDLTYNDTEITLFQVGHCAECKREYQWIKKGSIHNWNNADLGLT